MLLRFFNDFSGNHLRPSWVHVGPSWVHLGPILDPSWGQDAVQEQKCWFCLGVLMISEEIIKKPKQTKVAVFFLKKKTWKNLKKIINFALGPHLGPKTDPRWPQDGPKMASRWPQEGPRWSQRGPRWPQDAVQEQKWWFCLGFFKWFLRKSSWALLGTSWVHLGPILGPRCGPRAKILILHRCF